MNNKQKYRIVNKYGEEVVIEMNEDCNCSDIVAIHEDMELADQYILEIYKYIDYYMGDSEIVKEIGFEKEPTEQQILYYLMREGLTESTGYAQINKIKVARWKLRDLQKVN